MLQFIECKNVEKTKSFQWFLLLIRPTCSLINQWMTSSRGCGCCVDCIRWLSCRIADVFKNNFDQTIGKMKKKNHIIVIVMMWGRPEFINDRNLKRRFKGFWEDSAVRSSKNFARRIPMPGIEPGPWRWERQILTTRPHGMSMVEKLSSTSVVALTFRHHDIV